MGPAEEREGEGETMNVLTFKRTLGLYLLATTVSVL